MSSRAPCTPVLPVKLKDPLTCQAQSHDKPPSRHLRLDLLLLPPRALSTRQYHIICTAIMLIPMMTSLGFWFAGAWPVVGFLGIEWLFFFFFFRLYHQQAGRFEQICLSDETLTVIQQPARGQACHFTFQAYWARAELRQNQRRETRLYLTSHGQGLMIGAFLTDKERRDLHATLQSALSRAREGH